MVDAADSAVPNRVPNGVKPTALRRAGKVDDAVPDADVPTGRMSAKLNDMPGPRRQRTTEQFDRLDSDGSDYLGNTDIDDPTLKAADLFENTGPKGRRALNDLADGDREAADVLLEMDPNTQWRFTRAYDSDSVDKDELASALRRYDELDAQERAYFRQSLARSDDDAVELLNVDVCNSPCDDPIDAVFELGRDRSELDNSDVKRLLQATRNGESVDAGPGSDRGEFIERLGNLDDKEDLSGLDDAMTVQGNLRGYKAVTGEVRTADELIGRSDVSANQVTMSEDVPLSDVPSRYRSDPDLELKRGSEIDSKLETSVDIDGDTFESPAVESKNFGDLADDNGFVQGQRARDLRRKLETQAAAGEDEIVVATNDPDFEFSDEAREKFASNVNDYEKLSDIGDVVESKFDDRDMTVKFVSYDELSD
ncbi:MULTISPECIES: hypothetical protein [Haloarcula]|uniref:hypothetical protein n=1 Tax=Haloarcula TaxID=2237 RepID=UPI0023E8528F|nr:hypothetical protein [Halomicroarcula sp. SHR3]